MSTPDRPDDADTQRRRRLVLVVGGVVLVLAAVAAAIAQSTGGDEQLGSGLTVTWGGSEGVSPCVYDEETETVEAKILVTGVDEEHDEVTVTVTAYADENTSKPVGSATETVTIDGTMDEDLRITIPVDEPPHVGEDDVTACKLDVTY